MAPLLILEPQHARADQGCSRGGPSACRLTFILLDDVACEAGQGVASAALGVGEDFTRVLVALSGGLPSFSLEVFDQIAIPRPDDIVQRRVILARVGVMSIAEMRIWHKGFGEAMSEGFVANGRDPTPEKWAQLDAEADEIHGAIQEACAAEP